MELLPLRAPPAPWKAGRASHCKVRNASDVHVASLIKFNSHGGGRKSCFVVSALPETAASVAFAAMAVGAAASLLARTTKASDTAKSTLKACDDCGGSGICTGCNGEGFIVKKMSEESAERARLAAKNMATRYTAGLPKKWSYCSRCLSSRSCATCGGTGRIS
ncbi:hypothetical protein MUK42_07923 [Musa troglodytarum]|uniref:DUF7895 domain-containing protein n=1 Tax=Musa troglodytarum TaxID=320322 RepID=A0A9E7HHU0_9LILI|nr:hypothetical protein MUK42_07923 [Musa troglodytarum]